MTQSRFSRRALFGAAGAIAVGTGLGAAWDTEPASAAVRLGLDYSWGRPRPHVVVQSGYSFICRYLSRDTTGKNLTRAEADAARAAGLDIVVVWEHSASEALGGYAQGAQNAREAVRQAAACGMPSDRPIYFAVDFDATPGQQSVINSYFDGVASVIPRSRVGAYAGYYVMDRLFNAGKITWGWQTYAWSGGRWDSRAQLRQVLNGITVDGAPCDRNEAHAGDFGQWGSGPTGLASIYGILPDGNLTYTAVDVATGVRVAGAVRSQTPLGFTPKTMATLNFNTILINSTDDELYRIDVGSNKTSVTYTKTKIADEGWAYDRLTYDGHYLYGIDGGRLHRYTVTAVKPDSSDITGNTLIDSGFTLKTLTAASPSRLLGTTAAGELLWYKIGGAGDWQRYELRSSTWQVFDNLVSPGKGVYFGRHPGGSLHRYIDRDPGDGDGGDIAGLGTVDDSGWTQRILSAQPNTVS